MVPRPTDRHRLLPLPAVARLQASEYQSHRWTVYMRSPTGEDLSHVLKKVTFVLHESFTDAHRDVAFPPYELTETGWGEFDMVIKLHFQVCGSCMRVRGSAEHFHVCVGVVRGGGAGWGGGADSWVSISPPVGAV